MSCFCSARLASLLASLALIPPTVGLVPPISASLMAAASAGLPVGMSLNASMGNLGAMASLSTALQAALGMNLSAALAAPALPAIHATLSATINGFNANFGSLQLGPLIALLPSLSGLVQLAALVQGIHATFGIDLRASGAIAALQVQLAAPLPAMRISAVASLMSTLGFSATAQGALAVNALAQASASLMASLPPIIGLRPLSLLAGLMSMLAAIHLALGVNLRLPGAAIQLRAALAALPLTALAQLRVTLPTAQLAVSASPALNLAAMANVRLSGAASLAMLMRLSAQAGLCVPIGSCGWPCPLALLQGLSTPSLTAGVSISA